MVTGIPLRKDVERGFWLESAGDIVLAGLTGRPILGSGCAHSLNWNKEEFLACLFKNNPTLKMSCWAYPTLFC